MSLKSITSDSSIKKNDPEMTWPTTAKLMKQRTDVRSLPSRGLLFHNSSRISFSVEDQLEVSSISRYPSAISTFDLRRLMTWSRRVSASVRLVDVSTAAESWRSLLVSRRLVVLLAVDMVFDDLEVVKR